jgi:hypothetical protein
LHWGLLNAAMLAGLLAAAVPVVIHFLNRRRDQVVDWGAMQFLELGRRARQKIRLTELLLMLARMAVLAAVALALARPFWAPAAQAETPAGGPARGAPPKDVVLVVDGSASMDRKLGGTTPRALAVRWARRFVAGLRPGDSVAVLVAGESVRGLVAPPSFDKKRLDAALAGLSAEKGRGSSDLPAAVAEAFRLLERTQNPARDVIVLGDGQRVAWRPGETGRWALLRDLRARLPVPPQLWAVALGSGLTPDAPNGSLGPLAVSRALVTPGLPLSVSATLTNAGPGPLTRTAELVVDGQAVPGSAQAVGPVPEGGQAPLVFRTALPNPGAHLVAVKLVGGDDALPADDEAATPVTVAEALPVLLVDGEPGLEPLSGEADFLRAALAPTGDDTPQARATTVTADRFTPESLKGQKVLVLANVARLDPAQVAAVGRFLDGGGGVLVAPGDRTDENVFNNLGLLPARLGNWKGEFSARKAVAHPAPRSFAGPLMAPFGEGDSPALAEADVFAYRLLAPGPDTAVLARFDTGDPWVVEGTRGRGRVLLLAAPVDAEGGTLPVNPDFVPLAHEWLFHLASASAASRTARAGEPLVIDLPAPWPEGVKELSGTRPDGSPVRASVVRESGGARARVDDTSESGVYRLALPEPPGGALYGLVAADGRESDPAPLEPAEAAKLAEGWPLVFEPDTDRLSARLAETERGGRREVWRFLILAALAGLCGEIWLTRRLVRGTSAA